MQRSWIVLFVSSILMLPLYVYATPILKLTGQSEAVSNQAGLVAIWLIPLHFSFGFQFSLVRFLQCQLKMNVITVVSGAVLLIHVIISWLFVYKLRVGLVGTACTISFSWWLSTFGLFGYVAFGGCPDSWTGFSKQAFFGLWEFIRLSLASGVMLSLENFYYRVLIIVSGNMTNADVALNALSVCITIFAWESMIFLGFFAAAGVRVSNELGAGNPEGAKFASIVSVCTSLLVGLLSWIIIIAFSDKLAMIFTSNASVIKMVKELSLLLAFTVLLNSIQPVLSGVAVGSGWQLWVAFINLGSYYVVGVPLGIFLGWLFNYEIKAIWTGMISGTVVQTAILSFITANCDWKKVAQKASLHANQDAIN